MNTGPDRQAGDSKANNVVGHDSGHDLAVTDRPTARELMSPHVIGAAWPDKVAFAREQRAQPTRAEKLLWQAIRGGAMGVRFRRQHPIGDFVLDFYCREARLAVEIDGPTHELSQRYDDWRDATLARLGIRTFRIPPDAAESDIEAVLTKLRSCIATGASNVAGIQSLTFSPSPEPRSAGAPGEGEGVGG